MDDGQIITSETLKGEVSLIVFFIRVVRTAGKNFLCCKNIYGLRSKNPDGLY